MRSASTPRGLGCLRRFRSAGLKDCSRRLDALVFTLLTGHFPAQGEANAEGAEDDCHSRTGAGRPCWGRSAGVRPAAGTPPRVRARSQD